MTPNADKCPMREVSEEVVCIYGKWWTTDGRTYLGHCPRCYKATGGVPEYKADAAG